MAPVLRYAPGVGASCTQMLFFGYKLKPATEGGAPRMDAGFTEHSGCPLREGTKWIATVARLDLT